MRDLNELIRGFERLERALIDASSAIYLSKAGCFDEIRETIDLSSPPAVIAEMGNDFHGIEPIESREDPLTNDEALIACAQEHGLAVISEDKKILTVLEREGIPYYNALMMLHFLLFRKRITPEFHGQCLERLKKIAWYDKKVWAFGEEVFSLII